jgi:hypothetical protein
MRASSSAFRKSGESAAMRRFSPLADMTPLLQHRIAAKKRAVRPERRVPQLHKNW